MKVLVTGADGFIGSSVSEILVRRGLDVRCGVRQYRHDRLLPSAEICVVGDVNARTDWREALKGVEVIVHLAAIAHVHGIMTSEAYNIVHETNVIGLRHLLACAQSSGVRRVVYLSSTSVYGGDSKVAPLVERSPLDPLPGLGQLKLEAERVLMDAKHAIDVVILRAPMVYGPGNKGNMLRLLRLVNSGVPLPLGNANAPRDMLGIDNLADIVALCVRHRDVTGDIFLVRDGDPISTAGLVRALSRLLGKRPMVFPVPKGLLKTAAMIIGREQELSRLVSPLELDDARFLARTGWHPVCTLSEGLSKTVDWFLNV